MTRHHRREADRTSSRQWLPALAESFRKELSKGEPAASHRFPPAALSATFEVEAYNAGDRPGRGPTYLMDNPSRQTLVSQRRFHLLNGGLLIRRSDAAPPWNRWGAAGAANSSSSLENNGCSESLPPSALAGIFLSATRIFIMVGLTDQQPAGRSLALSRLRVGTVKKDHISGRFRKRVVASHGRNAKRSFLRSDAFRVKTRHNEVAPSQIRNAPLLS